MGKTMWAQHQGMHGMHGWGRQSSGKSMLFGLLVAWSLAWKAASLWRAANDKSVPWFATLFVVNSAGILDALYLFKLSPAHRRHEELLRQDEAEYQGHPQET